MYCPFCRAKAKPTVLETRSDPETGAIYRRRLCAACGRGYVTREQSEPGLRMPAKLQSRNRPKAAPMRPMNTPIELNWRRRSSDE